MPLELHVGPENPKEATIIPPISEHLVNLKDVDGKKKRAAHANVSMEIKWTRESGKIYVIAEPHVPANKRGRIPMIAGALLIIFLLNIGQLWFIGEEKGKEAIALAGEAFLSLKGASEAVLSSENQENPDLFQEAERLFEEAQKKGNFLLQSKSEWLARPEEVDSLENLLTAGRLMAELGAHVVQTRSILETLPSEGSLTHTLRRLSEQELEPAQLKLTQTRELLNSVNLSGTPYESNLLELQEKLETLANLLDLWMKAKEPLLTALGDRYPQHYLVLLENNDEMRLGGGFIGSIILVELNEGRLTSHDFHDIYEWDNRYFEHQEVPVHELRNLTNEWRLRDSNISADFPLSAQKAMWFLEEEGGPGVDGVIALNLSAAESLLQETGPLKIPSLPKEISAENFPLVISTLVEAKLNETHPKAILNEVVEAFLLNLKDPIIQKSLVHALLEEAQKKQILFYHSNPTVQEFFASWNLAGDLPEFNSLEHDFFMPAFTNIGGNKTDRYIETQLHHDTQIFEDGSMAQSISLTRKHTFTPSTLTQLKATLADYGFTAWNEGIEKVMGNAENRTGIRLYVPKNARIEDTEGILRDEVQFYYDPFLDMSYYYVNQSLKPGESKTFTLHLVLPWTFRGNFSEYKFDVYKQPGLKNTFFTKTVTAPQDMLLSAYPLATQTEEGKDYVLSGPLYQDMNLTLLYR